MNVSQIIIHVILLALTLGLVFAVPKALRFVRLDENIRNNVATLVCAGLILYALVYYVLRPIGYLWPV